MQPSPPFENRAPRLVSQTHYCTMGDVSVADGALIAPGVVLQAAPGSRIVIASGVCLAGGVCIQSRQGVLTLGAGVSLGANVLVIGHGSIGERTCIGAGSTLVNPQIPAQQLVPPNTLTPTASGVSQRVSQPAAQFTAQQVPAQQENDTFSNTFVQPPSVSASSFNTPDLSDQNGQYIDPSNQNNAVQLNNGYGNNSQNRQGVPENTSAPAQSALTVNAHNPVYGKDQVNQLLSTLFPHRDSH